MKTLLYYFIQMIVASGILYSYYHFVLRNKKFHHYNRFYLLAVVLISMLIPLFNIPVYFTAEEASSSFVLKTLSNLSPGEAESAIVVSTQSLPAQSHSNWFTWQHLSYGFYLLIVLLAFSKIIFSLGKIKSMIRKNQVERLDGIRFINTDEPGTPFSFFRWLFWNRKIELHSEKGEHVFRHEIFHIQQKHSLDILFMELITTILWINPFFHLMKKEMKAIHEFLADEFAINKTEKWKYAELLLMQAFNTQNPLLNPFFNNQIKRRIAMITSLQKTSYQYLRKLMVLPIAIIVIALFAFNYKGNRKPVSDTLAKPITVVIDAGHGLDERGNYTGVKGLDGSYEDEVVLDISQKIKELNTDKNIKIILTRDTKNIVDLKKRSDISNQQKADLFISIHANGASSDEPATSGAQVFVSRKNKAHSEENNLLGKLLLDNFVSPLKVNSDIRMRETGISVLDNSNCPAALIECGFMSDQNDLKFMKSASGQQQIAKAILSSIEQYSLRKQTAKAQDAVLYDTTKPQMKLDNVNIKWAEVTPTKDGKINPPDQFKNYLILVDGKETNWSDLNNLLQANEIQRIVMNDKATIAKYPEKAKNGVIEIFRKLVKEAVVKDIELTDKSGEKLNDIVVDNANTVDNKIWEQTETPPSYPGGDKAWGKFIQSTLNPNTPVNKGAGTGAYRVFVQFIVDAHGNVSDMRPLTKHGYGMEEEATRMIKLSGKWNPAIQNGHAVTAYKLQPITFIVEEDLGDAITSKLVTLTELKTSTPASLMGLKSDDQLVSFHMTIYNGQLKQFDVTGNQFPELVKNAIKNLQTNSDVSFENVEIKRAGQIVKRYPSVVTAKL